MRQTCLQLAFSALALFTAASCTVNGDKLQEKYHQELSKVLSGNQEKYDFLKELCFSIDEDDSGVSRRNSIDLDDYLNILAFMPAKSLENSFVDKSSDECLILHGPGRRNIGKQSYWVDDFIYDADEDEVIESKSMMKDHLEGFKYEVERHLMPLKYVIKITDKILYEPKVNSDSYESGYLVSHVEYYDMDACELLASFDVAAGNSDSLRLPLDSVGLFIDRNKAEDKLVSNLRERLEYNAKVMIFQNSTSEDSFSDGE